MSEQDSPESEMIVAGIMLAKTLGLLLQREKAMQALELTAPDLAERIRHEAELLIKALERRRRES